MHQYTKRPEMYFQILKWLATYKFLSVSQLMNLSKSVSILISKKQMYKYLQYLRQDQRKLIDKNSFAFHPKYGRLEDIYYLKHKGKKYLEKHLQIGEAQIQIPR